MQGLARQKAPPGARERATQPAELLEVEVGQCIQVLATVRRQLQAYDAVVPRVAHPLDQPSRVGPIHESHRAVVAEEEVVRHLPDGRTAPVGVATDGEQQLVLGRREAGGLRLLVAPAKEASQAGAQCQKVLIIGVPQLHRLTIASVYDVIGDGRLTPILERMTRPASDRPTPPRLPRDLPTEPDLRLTAGGELNGLTIQGDFSAGDLEGLFVEDSRIVHSSFTAADLNRLRLADVLVEGSDFSGADMEEASFIRVTFTDCRMSGALLPRTQMQDVTFSEGRLDGVNFRMIRGERIVFDHVNLERTEFYSAHLKTACFFDCDLSGADMSQVKLPGARFHGSVLSELRGSEYMRDVVIDSAQVLPLAKGVFAGLNIRVEDESGRPKD